MKKINVLAIDTAGDIKRIMFVRNNLRVDEVCFRGDLQACFWPALHDLLNKHRLRLNQFNLFAVNCGPGSWTGLRFGLAVVKGWAAAGGQKVLALPAGGTDCLPAGAGQDPASVEAIYGHLPRFKPLP